MNKNSDCLQIYFKILKQIIPMLPVKVFVNYNSELYQIFTNLYGH